jgi:hypothetical protein
MRLSLQYPRFFPSLLLSAFVLVALPLLAGIAGITYVWNRMAVEDRRSVNVTDEVMAAAQSSPTASEESGPPASHRPSGRAGASRLRV